MSKRRVLIPQVFELLGFIVMMAGICAPILCTAGADVHRSRAAIEHAARH